ncbi:hypothetical protein [Yersinia pekkanenii]|nr:hypothetical protein [Yersinia pekkanenii]
MNKQWQRWIDRPGWQLCLWQWGILGLFGIIAYGMLLRPVWQQQRLTTHQIIQQQQQIERQQSALARLPSLFHVRQQITVLRSNETSWRQLDSSMAHLVGELITPFGGRVMRWQRQSESVVEADVGSVRQREWQATLRVNFYGLLHLLRQLSEIPGPTQIQLVEINSDHPALTVKLRLKEYRAGETNE